MGALDQVRSNHRRVKASEILSRGSVQVLGESVYYEAAGMAEHGPTILFLHESGGSLATWHGQLTGLAQGARCVAPDLPGHGRSEGIGYGAVPTYRQVVLSFLDALAIRWPVVVAGVCLGAAIALDLAVHAPGRVAALILSGVSEGGRVSEEVRAGAARGEADDSFVRSLFGDRASPRLVAERSQRWRNTSPYARYADLTAMNEYAMIASFMEVTHPVLLMAGEADPIATPALARQLAAVLPQACAVSVPKAGCLAMMEQPAVFNRHVAEFVGRLPPAARIAPEVGHPGGYRRF